MKRWMWLLFVELLTVSLAQGQGGAGTAVRVALVKMPYVGERNVPDTSRGPDYLAVVLREWFNECAFQGAMQANQRQSLRAIFDFQRRLSIEIEQKLKED